MESLWDANKSQLPGMLAIKGGGQRAAAAAATAAAARRLFDWHIANLEFANSCLVCVCVEEWVGVGGWVGGCKGGKGLAGG